MKDFYRALVIVLFILIGQAAIDANEQSSYPEVISEPT